MTIFRYKGKSLEELYLDDLVEAGPCRLLVSFGPDGEPTLHGVESLSDDEGEL